MRDIVLCTLPCTLYTALYSILVVEVVEVWTVEWWSVVECTTD